MKTFQKKWRIGSKQCLPYRDRLGESKQEKRGVGEERKETERREYMGRSPRPETERGTSKLPVTPVGPSSANPIKSGI